MKYRPKHIAEYILLRGIVGLINILPYRLALLAGWMIAFPAHFIFRFRVKEAKRRIRQLLGKAIPEPEVDRIAWVAWRNFVFTSVDLIRMPYLTEAWIKKHVLGWEDALSVVQKYGSSGKGAVFATPHMGAWEIGAATLQKMGMPMFILVGQQKNPLTDAYINKMRHSTGLVSVKRGSGFLREVLRKLKTGGYLGFLPDVRAKAEGIEISFFGQDAVVPAGMALFAYQADVPITFGYMTRIGWTMHRIIIEEPIPVDRNADKELDWERLTRAVFSKIERTIRDQPEQWFWYNKRWILDPPDKIEKQPLSAAVQQGKTSQTPATTPSQ